ncbi:MAG: hypothetical protein WA160_14590 [Pseudobdellovibrio sp.]
MKSSIFVLCAALISTTTLLAASTNKLGTYECMSQVSQSYSDTKVNSIKFTLTNLRLDLQMHNAKASQLKTTLAKEDKEDISSELRGTLNHITKYMDKIKTLDNEEANKISDACGL